MKKTSLVLLGLLLLAAAAARAQSTNTITVSASPSAGGTVSGGGTFASGSPQEVTATANSGYTFANWTVNGNVVSSSATYDFTLSSNLNLVANFDGGGDISYQTLDHPLAAYGTYAGGIDGGNIVGHYADANGVTHGFLYNGSTYTTLDDPDAADNPDGGTYAQGISGSNIVGYYFDTNVFLHGFFYNGSTYATLDDPNGDATFANGISGNTIVGWYSDSSRKVHGFVYTNGNYTTLDDPSASGTEALGISGSNIVGYADFIGGILYNGSTYNKLAGSTVNGIDGDNVVGSSGNTGYVIFGNYITMDGIPYILGTSITLADPNGDTTSANGISGNTIVGNYYAGKGGARVSHGFIATVINYTITVSAAPSVGGTVSGGGSFISGSSQTVTATPYSGYTFANWTENGVVVSSSATYNYTVSSNLNLVANFTGEGDGTSYQTLDDPLALTGSSSIGNFALGISGSNIVGSYDNGYTAGFLYNGNTYTTLGVPVFGYPYTIATGISGSNTVGWYTDGIDAHGFLYANDNYTTLDDPNAAFSQNFPNFPSGGYGLILFSSQSSGYGGTFASGVSGGNIVGWYVDTNGYNHGFLYNGSTYTTLDDPHGVGSTFAQGISGGTIVGYYTDGSGDHGFLYNGRSYTTLDDPHGVGSTYAQGIDGGNIVGWYVDNSGDHGFLYNGSTYTTLDDPNGVGSTFAQGISGNTIVGWYFDSLGSPHGFTDTLGNPQTGSLQVTISPAGAVSAGAQWQLDGGALENSGATVSGVSTGSHTVIFTSVAGWTTPASQRVTVSAGQTTTAAGIYLSATGGECTYTLNATSAALPAKGGSKGVTVRASDTNCIWTAVSNDPLLTITSGSNYTGNGTIHYTVPPNTNMVALAGTMTIAGQTFSVTQAIGGCTYSISPKKAKVKAAGGASTVKVAPNYSDCDWSAASNDPFITITNGMNGTGKGTVSYTVDTNTDTLARIGTMTIASQTFTVMQAAAACEFSLGETNTSFSSTGGSSSVTLTANGTNCTWKATSSARFIMITSTNSASGDGTVDFTVGTNILARTRKGTITIAGKKFTVTQSGAP